MSRIQTLESLLAAALTPEHLEVRDESAGHAVPRGSESHARVLVVSASFEGQTRIARHRRVMSAAAPVLEAGLHALAIEAFTPAEWAARGGAVATSPACLGARKHTRAESPATESR
jgi:BolA protein